METRRNENQALGHMVANTVILAASQLSKINRPTFSDFKPYAAACKTQVTVEKDLSPNLRYD